MRRISPRLHQARWREGAHDAVRGVHRDAGRAQGEGRVRHRRLGLHGRARPLSRRRHPLLSAWRTSRTPRTWPTAMARVTNRPTVCIAQNGPGITNFVTAVAAAYWAHTPMVVVTPGIGQPDGGARRLPGNRADADLLQDHQVAGARQFAAAHGGTDAPRLHRRAARARPGAGQHPARLFLRRGRLRDPAAARHRARRGRLRTRSTRRRRCWPRRSSR